MSIKNPKSTANFARQVFLVSKVHLQREKAREDVSLQLQNMRKSIIRMSLNYSDIEKLKRKIDNSIECERKFSRFFRTDDSIVKDLKQHILLLEDELKKEREEKLMIISERDEKIAQLTESINNIKSSMKHLIFEKARKHQRLKILEKKIEEKVDRNGYYRS